MLKPFLKTLLPLSAALFGLLQQPLAAQNDPISVKPHWKKGEKKTVEVFRELQNDSAGVSMVHSNVHFRATITVLDSSDIGYLMEWKGQGLDDDAGGFGLEDSLYLRHFAPMYRLAVRYYVEPGGKFFILDNLPEIVTILSKGMDSVIASAKTPVEKRRAEGAKRVVNNPDLIEPLVTEYILSYHEIFGFKLPPGNSVEAEVLLQNAIGGEPFPGKITTTVTVPGKSETSILVEQKLTVNQEDADRIYKETMKALAEKKRETFDESKFTGHAHNSGLNSLRVNLRTGWVETIEVTKESGFGALKQITRMRMFLKG